MSLSELGEAVIVVLVNTALAFGIFVAYGAVEDRS